VGLKMLQQHKGGNFRCAGIEPDKQQPSGQMLICRVEKSD